MAEESENTEYGSRQRLRSRVDNMQRMRMDNFNAPDSPERIIAEALEKVKPELEAKDAKKVIKDIVLTPSGKDIEVSGKIVVADDIQVTVANYIETINSETTSENEYFRWIDEGQEVIKHMNDGFVSEDDLKEKHHLMDNLHQREAELMTCLGLYQSSKSPEAKEKFKILSNKLYKLREIRSAVKSSTKDQVDKSTREEYEKALLYYKAVGMLDRLSDDEKQRLGIRQEERDNFADELKFRFLYNTLSPAEELSKIREVERSKEDLANKINRLRGRRSLEEMLEDQAKKREQIKIRAFDKDRYMQLNTSYEREYS